jgi:hypothetical protein
MFTMGLPADHVPFTGWWVRDPFRRWHSLVLLLMILGLCWPLLVERGLMVQSDYPCWASIVRMFDQEVFPDCHWFWAVPFSRIYAGHVFSDSYSLSLIVPWLLTKVMSVEWALKTTVVLTYVVLGLGFYSFAAPRTGRLAGAVAAYLCVLENLLCTNYGMWYSSLSIGLAFFFFVVLERFVRRATPGLWLAAVMLFALAILAHPVGSVMAFCGWLGLAGHLFVARAGPRTSVRLLVLLVPLLGGGLAFPQIAATLSTNLVPVSQGPVTRYNPFAMLQPGLDVLVLAGAALGIYTMLAKKERVTWIVLPVLLVSYAVFRNLALRVPFDFPTKGGLIGGGARFSLVATAMILVLFAFGLAKTVTELQRPGRYRPVTWAAAVFLGLVLLGTGVFGLRRTWVYQPKTLISEKALPDHEDFQALCVWLAGNVDHERERIYVEDTYGRRRDFPLFPANPIGRRIVHLLQREPEFYTHYMSLIPLYTPCRQVNGFPVFLNDFGFRYCCNGKRLLGMDLGDLTPALVRERMWALNCRHIVAFSEPMREFLISLGFLDCSCRFGRFCVFTWRQMPPHLAWSEGPPSQVVPVTRTSNVLYEFNLDEVRGPVLYTSLQYHGNWRAYVGDRRVRIEAWNGLMRLVLPAGACGTLRLQYELHRPLSLAVATFSALLVSLGAVALRRQRGQSKIDEPSDSWSAAGVRPEPAGPEFPHVS